MKSNRKPNDILSLFEQTEKYVRVCAPMVRYTKVQFRTLVRRYNCDLCFSPMIMADSFCKSEKARQNEFTTNKSDTPLVVQFATNNSDDFVEAANLVSPYCDGVDLNCGCPQRWAKQLGVGCVLLDRPEKIYDIVRVCRNQISKPFTVSVKVRLLKDFRKTVEICKQMDKCGVSFITVHGRTASQLKGDVDTDAIKILAEDVSCPVIANGGITNLISCDDMYTKTNCKGIMVGNSLLTNPTLFTGSEITTIECVQDWLDICYNSTLTLNEYFKICRNKSNFVPVIQEKPLNLSFQCFHHHLVFMLEKILPRCKKRIFNNLQTFADVLKFINKNLHLNCRLFDEKCFIENYLLTVEYKNVKNCTSEINYYDSHNNQGKYFVNKTIAKSESHVFDYDDFLNIFTD